MPSRVVGLPQLPQKTLWNGDTASRGGGKRLRLPEPRATVSLPEEQVRGKPSTQPETLNSRQNRDPGGMCVLYPLWH